MYGDPTEIGQIAQYLAEEVIDLAQDKLLHRHQMEVANVMEMLCKRNLAIWKDVQWTVNGVPMVNGQNAPNHV